MTQTIENPKNILPYDGTVKYYGNIMPEEEANRYFNLLIQETPWDNDRPVIFGKVITTKRQLAWYGEPGFIYTYSGTSKTPIPWTEILLGLRRKVEDITGVTFNSCLLNLYHDGTESLGYHSDDERELDIGIIASVSLGAVRRFLFKHKTTNEVVEMQLESGSVVLMKGDTQKNWKHSLPVSKKVKGPRINLTFRVFKES
jgi:alkylated DNA repair dioxygenase AlkB